VLRDDKRAIFSAFSKAQAAADFILEPPHPARPAMLSSGPDEPAGRCAEMK
jgi:antirestriction protein ArdC